jgi:hypothetical protein
LPQLPQFIESVGNETQVSPPQVSQPVALRLVIQSPTHWMSVAESALSTGIRSPPHAGISCVSF